MLTLQISRALDNKFYVFHTDYYTDMWHFPALLKEIDYEAD